MSDLQSALYNFRAEYTMTLKNKNFPSKTNLLLLCVSLIYRQPDMMCNVWSHDKSNAQLPRYKGVSTYQLAHLTPLNPMFYCLL